MCTEPKFFLCKHCGNLIHMIENSGVSVVCCGTEMKELVANTSDGAKEKHVPVVEGKGKNITVTVGSTLHPMVEEHFIAWIFVKTNQGSHRKCLKAGGEPIAEFALSEGEKVLEVYEYCNIHGLWKVAVED